MKELVVEEKDNSKRLDIFLTENTAESRNFLLKNIKSFIDKNIMEKF